MKIKGTITREFKRENGISYCSLSKLDVEPYTQTDMIDAMFLIDLIAENQNYSIFCTFPAHLVELHDEVEIIGQVEEWNGDFFVRPDFQLYNVIHSQHYSSFVKRRFWDAIKEAALDN